MKKLIIIFFCLVKFCLGQDLIYENPNINVLDLSPSLAGSEDVPRIQAGYNNQYPNLAANFATYNFNADFCIKKINSGFGIVAFSDDQARGTLQHNKFGFIYNYHIKLSNEYEIIPAIEGTYNQITLDYTKLIFGDVLNRRTGELWNNFNGNPSQRKTFLNCNASLLLSAKNLQTGIQVFNINEPNAGLMDKKTIPVRISAFLNTSFFYGAKGLANLFSRYNYQNGFFHFQIGTNFRVYKAFYTGITYNLNNRNVYDFYYPASYKFHGCNFNTALSLKRFDVGFTYYTSITERLFKNNTKYMLNLTYKIAKKSKVDNQSFFEL